MNPIPLNDRGQYRYTDLVGYIPDFLREEPDVVELLQLFSDYMNNAYRNIEDVQQFEFKLCASEATVGKAKKRLGELRKMFELASGRNDRVAILSMPRSNVKSNAVFSRSNCPYTIDVGLTEIPSVIQNAATYDAKLASLNDGDVVYVNFQNIDGNPQVGYYVSIIGGNKCELIKDSMGGSQDPFTGTENSTDRMVTFNVSDVTSIHTRYGSTVRDCKYYEVFFTAVITDVESSDAFVHCDMGDDKLVVDYYGLHSVDSTSLGAMQYYSSIGFSGTDGWAWKGGYPTAIIYMIDSSSANLTTADYGSSESLADPSNKPSVSRYIVDVAESSGVVIATASTMVPTVNNMIVYMLSKDGEMLGRFSAEPVSGNPKQLRLTPSDSDANVAALISTGSAIMVTSGLHYSHSMGDVDGWASIKMKPVVTGGMPSTISRIYSCDIKRAVSNYCAGQAHITMMGGKSIHISGEACSYVNVEHPAVYLYCDDVMWNGVLKVTGYSEDDSGTIISYNTINRPTTAMSGDCKLYVIRSGFIDIDDGVVDFSGLMETFDDSITVILTSTTDRESYSAAINVIDGGYRMSADGIPDGKYFVTVLDTENYNGVITSVSHRTYNVNEQSYVIVASACNGDVYGGDYYVIMDDNGKKSVYYNVNGVTRYSSSDAYLPGDVVSYGGNVYRCDSQIQPGQAIPGISDVFVDITSDYKYFSRKYSVNEYMPFYGQIDTLEYEESIDYVGIGEPATFTLPLYICKAEDVRLKYGWEHREFLNYPTTMNRTTKSRNGYVELYDSGCGVAGHEDCFINEHNALTYTPNNNIKWDLAYNVIKRGCESQTVIYVDNSDRICARRNGDVWTVTIRSSAHGLSDGCEVSVGGFAGKPTDSIDINVGYTTVDVVDGDTFTYNVPVASDEEYLGSEVLIDIPDTVSIRYVGDYRYYVAGIPTNDSELVYTIPLETPAVGLKNGDTVYLDYMFDGIDSVVAEVYGDTVEDNAALTVKIGAEYAASELVITDSSAVRGLIHEGDVVRIADDLYRVSRMEWEMVAADSLTLPITLFAKDNLFDIHENNPETAVGEEHKITHMSAVDNSHALVYTDAGFEHFALDPAAVEMHTMVYINNAYPSDYNGWHLVSKVHGPNKFEIQMCLKNDALRTATGSNLDPITIKESRWYKYTINAVDWSKTSNKVTYCGANDVVSITPGYIATRLPHGFSVGDHVLFAPTEEYAKYSASHDVEFGHGKVINVINDKKFAVSMIDGSVSVGDGACRGIVLDGPMNFVARMSGEYTIPVFATDSDRVLYNYRFMDHSLVVAKAQYNDNERMVYMVNRRGNWIPISAKRALKISDISVEQYKTQNPFDYYDPTVVSDYTFNTYSDVDVAGFDGDYMVSGMHKSGNANFYAPALDSLDSTRNMMTEYSSGQDFANVAPRNNMDKSFKGIPDMKYPLAERIERLCYLRDPNVIDYELIGYLARFMGYDLTSVSDDIVESAVYRTNRSREEAVRAAVASLPQYYTLGGTEAGLSMLMDTFGVIGRAITLWTNTDAPYVEMISNDEVNARMSKTLTNGDGTWVPTPYIDLELIHDERYPQFECSTSDIARIREQIRTFKPINVVFRDVVEKYIGYISCNPTMKMVQNSSKYDLGAVRVTVNDGVGTQEPIDVDYGPRGGAVTNCAF